VNRLFGQYLNFISHQDDKEHAHRNRGRGKGYSKKPFNKIGIKHKRVYPPLVA
jgi:hypothetical protein